MAGGDTHDLGYERVDDDPDRRVLLDTMDATAQWTATRELRAWEGERLGVRRGERLLDVGCGQGDAALALGAGVGPGGEVVGVDVSATMIDAACERARGASCRTRFSVGDALDLDEPDGSFDVVRSERTLQWLTDPSLAVAEMSRVLRRAGRLSLLDTDWSTFALDVGDAFITDAVRAAMQVERGRAWNVGRRLGELVVDAGLTVAASTTATQRWDAWDPDSSPAPTGCFSMASLAGDLIEAGQLAESDREDFVATVHEAARRGTFSMSLTMHAVVATSAHDDREGTA